jgi:hypothetical protein
MSISHVATRALWLIPLVLQAAITVVMVRRRLVTIFPIFFSYTVLVLFRETALLFLRYPGNLYSLFYWCSEALAVLLGLGVIFETVRNLFAPYSFLRILLKVVWIVGIIAAVTALLMLVLTNGVTGADRVFEFIILVERSVRFLQACLLILVTALMSRLGVTWHHYSVGIVAGFGVYSALDLGVLELRTHLHFISDAGLVLLTSAAYNVAAIIWAFYFLRSWRKTPIEYLPKSNLTEWNEAVTEYVDQWYRRY